MRTKTIAAVAGVVVALTAGATALAATGGGPLRPLFAADRDGRRAELAHDLAGKLNVPEARVEHALDAVRAEREREHLREHATLLARELHVSEEAAGRALVQARSALRGKGPEAGGKGPEAGSAGPPRGPGRPREAFVRALATALHKTPAEVRDALKAARRTLLEQRLSEAVAAGRLTEAQADRIRQRIESGAWVGRGHHGRGGFEGPPPGPGPDGPPPSGADGPPPPGAEGGGG